MKGEIRMNEEIKTYLNKYPEDIQGLFFKLRDIVSESAPEAPEEKLWAKLPSYYVGEAFVRLIPFKNHINIEASAILDHTEEVEKNRLTPKGMYKLGLKDPIPEDFLKKVFSETLAQ